MKDGTIALHYIPSASMAANIFTKLFGKKKQISSQRMLGMSVVHSELVSRPSVRHPAVLSIMTKKENIIISPPEIGPDMA